jgi:hypothetical protein
MSEELEVRLKGGAELCGGAGALSFKREGVALKLTKLGLTTRDQLLSTQLSLTNNHLRLALCVITRALTELSGGEHGVAEALLIPFGLGEAFTLLCELLLKGRVLA